MAERHSGATTKGFLADNQVHELKLGSSFDKRAYSSFHTVRYDFKPASVDVTKEANLEVLKGNEISVTVPHIEGSGTNFTMFKGPQKPVQKECVLIIDNKTGEITLERLSSTIHLKKQRLEGSSRATVARPLTPVEHHNKQSKSSSLSPPGNHSSMRKKEAQSSAFAQDIERDLSPMSQPMVQPSHSPGPPSVQTVTHHIAPQPVMTAPVKTQPTSVEDDLIMSSSESSSSDDSSSDDASSDESSSEDEQTTETVSGSHDNMRGNGNIMISSNHGQHSHRSHQHDPGHRAPSSGNRQYMSQLREDLQLSESGSDSDEE
ncbi:ELL-associated factor 1-like [Ptychodera flava]|uniref:ELL-associated factor 1-like n=1 Tax=Ptychodera flava TaxID=63121 RepID=UPI003969F3EA